MSNINKLKEFIVDGKMKATEEALNEIIDAVDELNKESNLPVKLFSKEEELSEELQKEVYTNYMSRTLLKPDYRVEFTGYPTDGSERKATKLTIKSRDYDVLGIKIGMDIKEARKILEEKGYTEERTYHKDLYAKNDVQIYFSLDKVDRAKLIYDIHVDVQTYYLGNVVY